jgi:glycosyltransferase involved in cell wall biosynthesis
MSVAVCISTFHRPDGLAAVLASIGALALAEGERDVSVVVVNNDPDDEDPARICAEARERIPYPIDLLAEAERGLAPPRNRAIAHVLESHEFIAFIDDDSVATPAWLARLRDTQRRFDADIVTGPIAPRWERPPPAWIERGGFFARDVRPTGSPLPHGFTNNMLLRTAFLRETGVRFDHRFGLIGGEDTHFTRRARRRGATIVWADDAVVEDIVPAERMTASWLIRRHLRTGMTTAHIERDLRPAVVAWPLVAGKACVWTVLGAARLLAGLVAGPAARVRGRCWLAWGRGLARGLAGRSHREYLEER